MASVPILLATLKFPIVGVCGFVLTLWIGEVVSFNVGGVTLNLLLGFAILLSLLMRAMTPGQKIRVPRLTVLLVLYLAVGLVSTFLVGNPSGTSIAYVRSIVGGILIFLLVESAIERPRDLEYLALAIVTASVIVAIGGLYQLLTSEKLLMRYSSPLVGGPGGYGLYSLWGVPFAWRYFLQARKLRMRALWLGVFLLPLAAVIISGYRTGVIGLGVVAITYFMFRRRRSGVGASIAVVVAALLVVSLLYFLPLVAERSPLVSGIDTESDSVSVRVQSAQRSLEMFLAHPVFGVGLGNGRHLAPAYWTAAGLEYPGSHYVDHNVYTNTLAETGVVGMTFLLAVIGCALWNPGRIRSAIRQSTREGRGVPLWPILAMFAFYLCLELPLHQMYLRRDFFFLLALLIAGRRIAARSLEAGQSRSAVLVDTRNGY